MDGNMFSDVNGQYDPKPEFHVYDIVWGKVRGYPWWPGRICDPSASSNEAKMLFRKGSYLIDYFGDHSFTWNEAPHIKPFLEYFSQMEKQSNEDEFQNAIACALDEFLRRVELGVVCSCISEQVYPKLKNQIIISDGVRQEEEDSGNAGDGSLTAVSFEPQKLIMLLKEFAQFSYGKADQLELSTSVIQLSAFYCWKSSQLSLPTENDAYISVLGEKTQCNVLGHNSLPVTTDEKLVQKSKSKANNNDLGCCATLWLMKKQRTIHNRRNKILVPPLCLSIPMTDNAAEGEASGLVVLPSMSENTSEGETSSKLILQSSDENPEEVDAIADEDVTAVSEAALPVTKDVKLLWKSEGKDNSLHKCNLMSECSMNSSEKEKILSDLKAYKCLSTPMCQNGSEGKAGSKLTLQSCVKRKAVDVMADDFALKHRKSDSSTRTKDALLLTKDEMLVRKTESKSNSMHKCKHIYGDKMNPSKEQKSLSDLNGEKCLSPTSEYRLPSDHTLTLHSSSSIQKEVDPIADDSALEDWESYLSAGDVEQSFGVADFINMFLQREHTSGAGERICLVE
ncbi:uncharacterized protein LOC133719862 [Rosa rugosa]|uniref:uncharacterized protein LOC133719862 n=1 Tax=Rosa rugosa TaxID=74645 RepID=UPI002B4091CB|nr:uncharacterized protein LOC133719862 [Rosa rugosa]